MASIAQYYGIATPVPFHNVDVASDNRLYVDPHAVRVRRSPQPFARDAIECADSFLYEVTGAIIHGSPGTAKHGKSLLQRFTEPWETRMGMSSQGFAGHGGASTVGSWIWDTLSTNVAALVRVGLLRHLEDLPLFIDGVGPDITSDISTRIMFEPLARFTESMLGTYPEFTTAPHRSGKFKKQVWNPVKREWDEKTFTLPIANGKELLLVPDGWARPTLLMSANRYYGTTILSYAQLEQAIMTHGKLLKTPKRKLRDQTELRPGRTTNIDVTTRAFANDEDLVAAFKRFVDERYEDAA